MKANGNGRIVHEVTTNGGVSNPGNTQETAQFILTVGKVVAVDRRPGALPGRCTRR